MQCFPGSIKATLNRIFSDVMLSGVSTVKTLCSVVLEALDNIE